MSSLPVLHDVIIIGAGPCGLAVASRLCEPLPAASFTDDEFHRYKWLSRASGRVSIKNRKTGKIKQPKDGRDRPYHPPYSHPSRASSSSSPRPDMLVLDSTGNDWMTRWHTLFATFEIPHLRSPLFFHVDPAHRDGLLTFAHHSGRQAELTEIRGCVGCELSKHKKKQRMQKSKVGRGQDGTRSFVGNARRREAADVDERDRNDYFCPSTALYRDQCAALVERYGIHGRDLIRREKVCDIEYRYAEDGDMLMPLPGDKIFVVHTDMGNVHFARTVVLAMGPANEPCIPRGVVEKFGEEHEAMGHVMMMKTFPSPRVTQKLAARQRAQVLIVGGGLTSAQLADLAIRRGVNKVWLVMRGPMKIKVFDIGLEWVDKFRNVEQARFWSSESHAERADKIHSARNGGSITPTYRRILEKHVASGRLEMCLHTEVDVEKTTWDAESRTWFVRLGPSCQACREEEQTGQSERREPVVVDHVYFATGVQTNVHTLPCLQTMMREFPIDTVGGMPCITEEMKWRSDVPLFVSGRLAELQIGPGARNLIGCRVGAERVAWGVEEELEKGRDWAEGVEEKWLEYVQGSRYTLIGEAGEEE